VRGMRQGLPPQQWIEDIRGIGGAAPAAAVVTALASLACCLPWGIAALLGSVGFGLAFERHRLWLIALSVVLLAFGAYSLITQHEAVDDSPKPSQFFSRSLYLSYLLSLRFLSGWPA
jgi:hypothetical protein